MFTNKDASQQEQLLGDKRHNHNSAAEGQKQAEWITNVKSWFTGIGGAKRQTTDMSGLYYRVTGEELVSHFEKIITGINERLESKTIVLPHQGRMKMEYRKRYYTFMAYHIDPKRVYWMTGEEVESVELIQSQEENFL
jgi:hypothetical protein